MAITRRRFLAGAATLAGAGITTGIAASCGPITAPPSPPPTTTPPTTTLPPPLGALAQQVFGPGGQAVIRVDAQAATRAIEPGAFGYGAMWPSRSLWPAPPSSFTNATHDAYVAQLAATNLPLVKRIRTLISDPKVVIVASGAETAKFGGVQLLQANAWNQPVYAGLAGTSGIAFAIRGNLTDLSTSSSSEWPWPAIVAHADLAREAFASPTSSYLPWTWFPAPNPAEWSHGALRNGALSQRADALAFMSKHHREQLLTDSISGATTVRANVTREQGAMWATGGNFSRSPVTVTVDARNLPRLGTVAVELLDAAGHHTATWNGAAPLALDPMQLARMRVI